MACFPNRRKSGSRAVALTRRRCASMSRRCFTASARASTSSRSFCFACARGPERVWWPIWITAVPLSKTAPAAGRLLEIEDVSALFGLDMAGEESPVQSGSDAPPASKPTAKARQARGGGNTGAQKRSNQNPTTVDHTSTEPKRAALKIDHTDKQSQPMAQTKRHKGRGLAERFMEPATIDPALAALEPTEVSAPLPTFRNAKSEKLAIKRHKATQTVARAEPIQPPSAVTDSEPARSKTASMRSKVSTRSRPSKPALELTPDGFVKWWK